METISTETKSEQALYNLWENLSNKQQKNNTLEKLEEEKFNQPVKIFLKQEFANYKGEKILDDGSGLYSETYLPEEYEVYSVDWLPHIKNIKNSYVGNAETLPFADNEFGIVLSKQVYGYLKNPEKCLAEMVRVLKPKGLLVLIDWEGDLKNESFRVKNFEPQKVADQIKSMDFEIIKSVRLIDRTKKINNVYLTAIVAKKNCKISTLVCKYPAV